LIGIISGLKALKFPCAVEIKTANEYLSECAGRILLPKSSDLWIGKVHKGTAKNADLWQQFEALKEIHRICVTDGTATVLRREIESARYWAPHGRSFELRND
jgi:ribonuclease HI